MALAQKLQRLDGRHKLAILMALGAWVVSIYFSQVGFGVSNHRAAWLGWFLGALVTTVELMFNSKTHKLSITLIWVGIICYAYGVWTNVTGFWDFQNPNISFVVFSQSSIMSWFVGVVLEVLPEPMFMWGIGAELDGDLIGNIVGLWNGNLEPARPGGKFDERPQPNYKPTYPPYRPVQNQGKSKPNRNMERVFHSAGQHKEDDTQPNRFNGFGE